MCSAHQPEFFEGRKRFCSASAEDQHKGGERGVEIQHAIPNTNANTNTNTSVKFQHKESATVVHCMLWCVQDLPLQSIVQDCKISVKKKLGSKTLPLKGAHESN